MSTIKTKSPRADALAAAQNDAHNYKLGYETFSAKHAEVLAQLTAANARSAELVATITREGLRYTHLICGRDERIAELEKVVERFYRVGDVLRSKSNAILNAHTQKGYDPSSDYGAVLQDELYQALTRWNLLANEHATRAAEQALNQKEVK